MKDQDMNIVERSINYSFNLLAYSTLYMPLNRLEKTINKARFALIPKIREYIMLPNLHDFSQSFSSKLIS